MAQHTPRVHVCFGTPDLHLPELRKLAERGKSEKWTINKAALPGDRVVFYLIRPISSFVASAMVASKPIFRDQHWVNQYLAKIEDVQLFPRGVHLGEAQKQFPEWGFLRQPRRSTQVPEDMAQAFIQYFDALEEEIPAVAEESDVEGLKYEVTHFARKRSRALRNTALIKAKGVCSVCQRDFSLLLNGRGVRVLQVHHRKQLSTGKVPSVTKESDLVVVCANCHLLLHMDHGKALKVERLRKMLQD